MSQAPEGFPWVRSIRCFIRKDQVVDPDDPEAPRSDALVATVWAPVRVGDDVLPVDPAAHEFDSGDHYPRVGVGRQLDDAGVRRTPGTGATGGEGQLLNASIAIVRDGVAGLWDSGPY